jgi:hypothetical protein
MLAGPTYKTCQKCGISQPLERFPFRKAEQSYRGTCKACRAAESRARRRDPEQGQIIREREEMRNHTRQEAIKKWQREHPDNMRPGRQRRWARRNERLKAARLAARTTLHLIPSPDAFTP